MNRPCGTNSREKNRYTRQELEKEVFKLVKKMAMDELCQLLKVEDIKGAGEGKWDLLTTSGKNPIYYRDVGGGGNCLFFSLSAALGQFVELYGKLNPRVEHCYEQSKKDKLYFRKLFASYMNQSFVKQQANELFYNPDEPRDMVFYKNPTR